MKKKFSAILLSAVSVISLSLTGCGGPSDVIAQINAETDTTNPLIKTESDVIPINTTGTTSGIENPIAYMSPADFPSVEGYLLTPSDTNTDSIVIVDTQGEICYYGTLSDIIQECYYSIDYPETLRAVCYDRGALIITHHPDNIAQYTEYVFAALYPATGESYFITAADNASATAYNNNLYIVESAYAEGADFKCINTETCYSRNSTGNEYEYVKIESLGDKFERLNDKYQEIVLPFKASDGNRMSISEALETIGFITVFDGTEYYRYDKNRVITHVLNYDDILWSYRYDSDFAFTDYHYTATENNLCVTNYETLTSKCIASNIDRILANENGCIYYATFTEDNELQYTYHIYCYNAWTDETLELYSTEYTLEADDNHIDGVSDFYCIGNCFYTTIFNGDTTNWYQITNDENGINMIDTGCVVITYPEAE